MTPIEVGLSQSTSTPASSGSGAININANTYASNPVLWIAVSIIGLVGVVLYLKLR